MANVIGSGIARTIVDAEGDPVNVSDTGNLMVDIGAASISGDLSVNLTQTDKVSIWGNEQADGEGTARAILTDDGGRLQIDVITAPSTAVTCDTAGNLLATVTQQSTARTVTGTVGHNITGMTHAVQVVGIDAINLSSASCKRIDLMGNPNNAGNIYIGSANTIQGNGAVGGIRLQAGDFYSIDIDDTDEIYAEASEVSQILNYIYYT